MRPRRSIWARYLREGSFQPTIASAFGLGRGWGAIWPFLLAAGGARGCWRRGRRRGCALAGRGRRRACSRSLAWALFAALAPTVLGIDHQGLLSIVKAGDHTALNKALRRLPAEDARADRRARGPARARRGMAAAATSRAARAAAPVPAPDAPRPARRRSCRPQLLAVLTLHFAPCSWRQTHDVAGPRLVVGVRQPGVEARRVAAAGPVVDVQALDPRHGAGDREHVLERPSPPASARSRACSGTPGRTARSRRSR